MAIGLTDTELSQFQLSVGYTLKDSRPLSPVEVGQLCHKSEKKGFSRTEITSAALMTDPGMISQFLKVSELDPSLQHLIDWGRAGVGVIGFSVGYQLTRFNKSTHKKLATLILKHQLTKIEMRDIHQLVERSNKPLAQCVSRVVSRRPVQIVRSVIIGAVVGAELKGQLKSHTQKKRDQLLHEVFVELYPALKNWTVKLGINRFTVIGGKIVENTIAKEKDFETMISRHLQQKI